jgi:hypothetical protein
MLGRDFSLPVLGDSAVAQSTTGKHGALASWKAGKPYPTLVGTESHGFNF